MKTLFQPRLLGSVLLLIAVALSGCQGSIEESCPGCDLPGDEDPAYQPGPSGPVSPELPSCNSDATCTAPYVCNLTAGKCVPPSAKNSGTCDPVEGKDCPAGEQCITGICIPPPSGCQSNDDCPVGYLCQNGACVADGGGQPGCTSNSQCGPGQVCLSGLCKPTEVCNIPHAPDRLAGLWKLDSQLHVRDGLEGFTKGLLGLASTTQKIIEGKFSISGVPSFLTSLVGSLLQNVIKQYVPPWGYSLIALLADIDDVIDDTRVISTEQLTAIGGDMYLGSSTWQIVEFEYKGVKVSTTPEQIPGLGKVTTEDYSAREVCGVLYLDKHKVKNAIGKVFRWGVEAAITGVSCSMQNGPCYKDLPTMFHDLIDCNGLAAAVGGGASQIPGLDALVLAACVSQKQSLVNLLIKELEALELKLTYMSLGARADIGPSQLVNGRWYGTLGNSSSKANFEGTFTGTR